MAKLSLVPNPTFQAKVAIPVPGATPVEVEFTFKHRDRSALDVYLAELKELTGESLENDVAIVLKVVSGWELDDPFNADTVRTLVGSYHGSAWAIANTYIRELMQAKLGN
jgi:hypothetical protein